MISGGRMRADHEPAAALAERPASDDDADADGCIPFRLRIGVIGHRVLSDTDELRRAVRKAIDLAVTESGYSRTSQPSTPLRLTVVSSLAEGADRLVAEEVLRIPGSQLVCVLPVPRNELHVYKGDFESRESKEEFQCLYERAWYRIYPKPGTLRRATPEATRNAGYLWAGRQVLYQCDVLIALWDGQPPRGEGGTADLIYRMREHDARLSDARPSLANDGGLFNGDRAPGARVLPAEQPLVFDTAGPLRIFVPTNGNHEPETDDDAPYDTAAGVIKSRLASDLNGLSEFNSTKIGDAEWRRAREQTANELAAAEYQSWPRIKTLFEQITPPMIRADQSAMSAHRWFIAFSYALFLSTAVATIIAALQAIVFPGIWELTIGEAVLLIASVGIVALERRWKNHERWLAYRFLAERLRSACYLLAVGVKLEREFAVTGTPENPAQNAWIGRALISFLAEQDTTQAPNEPLETLSKLVRVHWVEGQISYFESASRKQLRYHHRVQTALYAALGITIAAAVVHTLRLWPFHSTETQTLIMLAIGLPAVAGALTGIRGLREFRRHSLRYARMANVLRKYLDQFDYQSDIGSLVQLATNIDDILIAEARGWLGAVAEQGLEIH
jgi:hypothetical protein